MNKPLFDKDNNCLSVLGKWYSEKTLMSYTKAELIEMLRLAQLNYEASIETRINYEEIVRRYQEALNGAIYELSDTKCPRENIRKNCKCKCYECWQKYFFKKYLGGLDDN